MNGDVEPIGGGNGGRQATAGVGHGSRRLTDMTGFALVALSTFGVMAILEVVVTTLTT
jgi:hypothetical protein